MTCRVGPIFITLCLLFSTACKDKAAAEGERLSPEVARAEAAPPSVGEQGRPACTVKVRGDVNGEWVAFWRKGKPGLGGGVGAFADSTYWSTEEDLEIAKKHEIDRVLTLRCIWEEGTSEGSIELTSPTSTRNDLGHGPGKYPIVGQRGGAKAVRPGQFMAVLVMNKTMYDATSGTLEIQRFDGRGVAGSFKVSAKRMVSAQGNPTGPGTIEVEGSFDIACGGTSSPVQHGCKQ